MQYKKKYIKDQILQAGLNEYLVKGYRQGSISSVAQSAGVPVGNLYRYFDGKSGLLDALVKPAYDEIPKIVQHLAEKDTESVQDSLLEGLAESIIAVLEEYGQEMLLLADGCTTSRYEDFVERLVKQVGEIIYYKLYADNLKQSRVMSSLTAKAFVHSIFDLIRSDLEKGERDAMVLRTVNFYFYNIAARK